MKHGSGNNRSTNNVNCITLWCNFFHLFKWKNLHILWLTNFFFINFYYHYYILCFNLFRQPPYFLSWTSKTLTTWSGYVQGMSGKWRLAPLKVTLSFVFYYLFRCSLTPLWYWLEWLRTNPNSSIWVFSGHYHLEDGRTGSQRSQYRTWLMWVAIETILCSLLLSLSSTKVGAWFSVSMSSKCATNCRIHFGGFLWLRILRNLWPLVGHALNLRAVINLRTVCNLYLFQDILGPEYTVNFITDLPDSSGNTEILTVVDHFSKAMHLIALPKLLSTLETAKHLLIKYFEFMVFWENIVSGRDQM